MTKRPPFLNRCVFIEGIGRVHVIGRADNFEVASMDSTGLADEFVKSVAAYDVLTGKSAGRIRWAVRFIEKAA